MRRRQTRRRSFWAVLGPPWQVALVTVDRRRKRTARRIMAKEARTGHIVYVHTQNLYLGFHEAERACALQAFRYTSMPSRRAM